MNSRYFTILVMIYITLMYVTIIMALKPIIVFGKLVMPGAIFVFPMTYFINDAIAEIYGFKIGKKVILCGFFLPIFICVSNYLYQSFTFSKFLALSKRL